MSKTVFCLSAISTLLLFSCSTQQKRFYEFDELYTSADETYISDYVPSANTSTKEASNQENDEEDDYVSNANRNQNPTPWTQNGWGNSGYGSYNYGAYNQFNCGTSLLWMPYWAYSPNGFYNSPYAYYGYGMGYGVYGSSFYNPYYSPYFSYYGGAASGNWDNHQAPVVYGSRQPISSNSGVNSSYSGGRFYLGQTRQALLQKPKPVMTTSKPDEKIPSGKINDNIARAYKTADRSKHRDRDNTVNRNPSGNPGKASAVKPEREVPKTSARPQQQSQPYERPSAPSRPAAPSRTVSPGKTGRP